MMDVNVESTIAQMAEAFKQSEPPKAAPVADTEGEGDASAAILAMIAEVKAAEPHLAERLGAASAEWYMIKAIKAAEPYLASEEPGSAAAKMLRAVTAAEPFSSRRMDAAAAVWNIVLAVKEAEPRIERQPGEPISPAELAIVRAVKAAEPYLVQDLDMGNTASKLLRAVKASEPRKPRFESERAEAKLLKNAKWSEPVLRRHSEVMGETGPGTAAQVQPAAPAASASRPESEGKPSLSCKAARSPIQEPASASTTTSPEAEPATEGPARRHMSKQPVRYLGVTDSGEWKFTLMSPLDGTPRDGGALQIQSREIMLCRQSQRSWAGELLSLWQS